MKKHTWTTFTFFMKFINLWPQKKVQTHKIAIKEAEIVGDHPLSFFCHNKPNKIVRQFQDEEENLQPTLLVCIKFPRSFDFSLLSQCWWRLIILFLLFLQHL